LPEYVTIIKRNGRACWVAAETEPGHEKEGAGPDFYHRARVDLELVVDGAIIVLAKLHFPAGTPVRDERFPIPALNARQRNEVIQGANKTFSRLVRTDTKTRTDLVPVEIWDERIAGLNPIRVVNDRVNMRIVLFETGGMEGGFYIIPPISSYRPNQADFLEFQPLTQAGDRAFGEMYRYKSVAHERLKAR
jgi:hypothetical protein